MRAISVLVILLVMVGVLAYANQKPMVAATTGLSDIAKLVSLLRSKNTEAQIVSMEDFLRSGPEQFGVGAIEVIRAALVSDSSEVQVLGLQSLHQLSAADRPLAERAGVEGIVNNMVSSHHETVSVAAIDVVAALYPESVAANDSILNQARHQVDQEKKAAYLRALGPKTAQRADVRNELLLLAAGRADIVSVEAAKALLRAEAPPKELLPDLVRLIQDRRFFGHRALVNGIARYGADAAPYVPALQEVLHILRHETSLSYDKRTVNVSRQGNVLNVDEDPEALAALERAIDAVSEAGQLQ